MNIWDFSKRFHKNPAALWNTVKSVTLGHLRALAGLQQYISDNPPLQPLPLSALILHYLVIRSRSGRCHWAPQSHFRAMTEMIGAFSNLGKYATNFEGRVHLDESAEWRAALKSWDRLAKAAQPTELAAATADDIKKAVDLNVDPQIRAALILLWLLAMRKGDVCSLRSDAVQLREDGRLLVFVKEGKGVKARQGMYHVASHVPPVWFDEIKTFLESAEEKYLFRSSLGKSSELIRALRLANPDLSVRATRRGAARALASDATVSEETIMKITGHKSVKTLHRYLGWDKVNEASHSAAQRAAQNNLAPSALPPPPAPQL